MMPLLDLDPDALIGVAGGDESGVCRRRGVMRDAQGRALGMQAPLAKAGDCALHRHLSQLAATHALFLREKGTLQALKRKGIDKVEGALLYVTDHASGENPYYRPSK